MWYENQHKTRNWNYIFERKRKSQISTKPAIAKINNKKGKTFFFFIFIYLDLGGVALSCSSPSSSSLSATFSPSIDCCSLSTSLPLLVFLLLYSNHTKMTCTKHCKLYPQIHSLIGVFGLSFAVTTSIVTETTTNAAFHRMSNATTGFEYPQSARLSSSSRAAVSLTSMDGPRRPVARPRRTARVVWLAVGEVGESCRGRRSGAWESFSDDILGQSLVRVSEGAVVVLI